MGGYQDEMIVAHGAERALQRAGLDSVGRVLRCLGDHTVAWSRSSDTIRVGPGRTAGQPTFFVKRYHCPKLSRRLGSLVRRALGGSDRARWEYEMLRDLEGRGLPVVRAVAAGRRRRRGMLRSCFLITESFSGGHGLERLPAGWKDSPQDRRALIGSLARAVAGMHQAGVTHGRLFRRNVLVRRGDHGGYDVRFLDFAPVSSRGRRGVDAAGDLGALGSGVTRLCSRTECLRFMRMYLGRERPGATAGALMRAAARIGREFEETEKRRLALSQLFEEPAAAADPAITLAGEHRGQ